MLKRFQRLWKLSKKDPIALEKLTEEDLASLTTEIELLNSLNHPHIIKYVIRLNFVRLFTL